MAFEDFKQWLSENLQTEREFITLGRQSHFHAHYDHQIGLIKIRLRTGSQYELHDNQIEQIFERYMNGTPAERNMTSYYTDPWWRDTPNRISAPAIPPIINFWIQQ